MTITGKPSILLFTSFGVSAVAIYTLEDELGHPVFSNCTDGNPEKAKMKELATCENRHPAIPLRQSPPISEDFAIRLACTKMVQTNLI